MTQIITRSGTSLDSSAVPKDVSQIGFSWLKSRFLFFIAVPYHPITHHCEMQRSQKSLQSEGLPRRQTPRNDTGFPCQSCLFLLSSFHLIPGGSSARACFSPGFTDSTWARRVNHRCLYLANPFVTGSGARRRIPHTTYSAPRQCLDLHPNKTIYNIILWQKKSRQ